MDIFGSTEPRKMPGHLFFGAIHKDYDTAIRSNPEKQNCSVCPRHWYIDAVYACEKCGQHFTWTAQEQKTWFEDYCFWIDSEPRHCKKCMADQRRLKQLRLEYDSRVSSARANGTYEEKKRIIQIIENLESAFSCLPGKMIETKSLFQRQVSHMENKS